MSEAITGGQARSLIASFSVDTPWDEIPVDVQPFIELTPIERGKRFAAFVKNGCRLVTGGKLLIDRSKPFNPAEFIGQGWSIWRGPADGDGLTGEEEQDARSLALTEVDLGGIALDITLNSGETTVTGEECLRRLGAKNAVRMDAGIFQALWNNKYMIPERLKEKTSGNTTYVFVDGTTLRSPVGCRASLYFCWDAGARGWNWSCRWLGDDRSVSFPSALLAN